MNHHLFDHVNPPATSIFSTHDLLVMLGMLVGHAGDVGGTCGGCWWDMRGMLKTMLGMLMGYCKTRKFREKML